MNYELMPGNAEHCRMNSSRFVEIINQTSRKNYVT